MIFAEAVEALAAITEQSIPIEAGDYEKDGLLHCGKCNTPKECLIPNPFIEGRIDKRRCMCKCRQEEVTQEEHNKRVQKLREKGFANKEMLKWTFFNDDMANPRLTQVLRNYVDNFDEMLKQGKGLLLYGMVGTGKTYAAYEVANAIVDKEYPVLATNFTELTNNLQSKFEGKQDYINSLNNNALLLLDDLGVERKTEFMQEMVYNIIDSRYKAGLPMIITTNLSIDEIKTPTDIGNARIYDRILERCFPIEVTGQSRRRKAVRESYGDMKELLGL